LKRVLGNIPNQRHAAIIEKYLSRELEKVEAGNADGEKTVEKEDENAAPTSATDKVEEHVGEDGDDDEDDDGEDDDESEYEDLLADEDDDIAYEFDREDEDEDIEIVHHAENGAELQGTELVDTKFLGANDRALFLHLDERNGQKSDVGSFSNPSFPAAVKEADVEDLIDLSDSDSEEEIIDVKVAKNEKHKELAVSPDSIHLSASSPTFNKGGNPAIAKLLMPTTATTQLATALHVNFQFSKSLVATKSKSMSLNIASKNPRLMMKNGLRLAAVNLANSANAKRWEIKDKDLTLFLKAEIQISKLIALLKFKERRAEQNAILREMYEKAERERKQEEILRRYEQFADDDDEGELDFKAPSTEDFTGNQPVRRRMIEHDEYVASPTRYDTEASLEETDVHDSNLDEPKVSPDDTEAFNSRENRLLHEPDDCKSEHDDEALPTRFYSKKSRTVLTDEDNEKSDDASDSVMRSAKGDDLDGDSTIEEEETVPMDPVERMKLERAKALDKNKSYRQQIIMEDRLARGNKKSALIEDEAEEDEEEGLQGGLDDYGFGSLNKEKDMYDEANALKMRANDFDHIVDDVSDDEGDEEAGEKARLEMDRKRDIQETKKIIDAVVLGQDKFREMRSLGGMFDQKTLVGEDDKRLAGEDGEEGNEDNIEDFDDDAYYAKQLEIRLAQEAKEREEEERLRKLQEEEEQEEMESKTIQ
jgi:hypothetical protein